MRRDMAAAPSTSEEQLKDEITYQLRDGVAVAPSTSGLHLNIFKPDDAPPENRKHH
jgi:hypothetical protein